MVEEPFASIGGDFPSLNYDSFREQANPCVIPTVRLKEEADAGLNILPQNGASWSVKVVS
jgi:hypothetical protein